MNTLLIFIDGQSHKLSVPENFGHRFTLAVNQNGEVRIFPTTRNLKTIRSQHCREEKNVFNTGHCIATFSGDPIQNWESLVFNINLMSLRGPVIITTKRV